MDCGAPPNTDNGRYALLNATTTYGSLVEYTCSDDYWLDGQRLQHCTREGKWSADTPSCECKFVHYYQYLYSLDMGNNSQRVELKMRNPDKQKISEF